MSLPCEPRILNALRKHQALDDECVAYLPEQYSEFTIDEFREFTEEVFHKEGGGWDNVYKFQDKNSYFEAYNIPFKRDDENFYLCVIFGQNSVWTLMNESHFQETQKRLVENNYYRDEDDCDDRHEVYKHEIGGEG